jgi:hypothetical protein
MSDCSPRTVQIELDLQGYNIDLCVEDQKIKALVQIFEERWMLLGPYYEYSTKAAEIFHSQGV